MLYSPGRTGSIQMTDQPGDDLLAHPEVASALSLERADVTAVCQRCGRRGEQAWTLTLGDDDAGPHLYEVCSDCAALFTRSLTFHGRRRAAPRKPGALRRAGRLFSKGS